MGRTLESRRAQLMQTQTQWGDPLPLSSARGIDHDQPVTALCHECDSTSHTDMERRVVDETWNNPVHSCQSWSLSSLLANNRNFIETRRISVADEKLSDTIGTFDKAGVPLVIQDLHNKPGWRNDLLSLDWLRDESEINDISVRNIHNNLDSSLSLADFIEKTRETPQFVQPEENERFYGKDLDCPAKWTEWLCTGNVVPNQVLPTHDNILSHLPKSSKVDTLMCYIGAGDTFTPSHKDSCASNGHNLMCYSENGGSAFWFMTEQKDARKVADYFHNKLGHEIDHESYVTTVEEFADAPFNVYVLEQKVGDLVLVPRMSCHQVVNYGGLTVKLSWSRMTVKGAIQALYHELPLYRRVCRREIYRIRFTLYQTIVALTEQLCNGDKDKNCFRRLTQALKAFDDVLKNECVADYTSLPCIPSETFLTCDFCGADIFQSFFECNECHTYDSNDSCAICADCFIEGRSCRCRSMRPMQVQPLGNILRERRSTVKLLEEYWQSNPEEQVPVLKESELFSGGAFKAGCLLARSRNEKKGSKSCSSGIASPLSHHLSEGDAIYCQSCHHGTCHFHLLRENRLHTIKTLLSINADPKKDVHHQRHREGKEKYAHELSKFQSKESKAEKVEDLEVQLVNLALNFPRCRPINYSYTHAGWYDEVIVAPVTITINKPPNTMASSPPPPYEEGPRRDTTLSSSLARRNPSAIAGPSNETATAESSSSAAAMSPPKRKKRKLVMECVLLDRDCSAMNHGVITVSSDSESSPPRTRTGRPRISDVSHGPRPREADAIVSGPNANGRRAVAPSNFTSDLALALNVAASTEESTPSASSSSASAPTSSRRAVPKAKKVEVEVEVEVKRTEAKPASAKSSGKRPVMEIQSDHDSTDDDDEPIIAKPHIPPTKSTPARRSGPVVALGGRKDARLNAGSRSNAQPSVGFASTSEKHQREDGRLALPGPKKSITTTIDVAARSASRVPSVSPGADSKVPSKHKATLPSFSKTTKKRSSDKGEDGPIAESSRMASMRHMRESKQRVASLDREERGRESHIINVDSADNIQQSSSSFAIPQTMLPSGNPELSSSMFVAMMKMLQQEYANNEELRSKNAQLTNQLDHLQRENARVTAQQQQQQQQTAENNVGQALIQGAVLPGFIQHTVQHAVDASLKNTINGFLPQVAAVMNHSSNHMGVNFPQQPMNMRNDYVGQPARYSRGPPRRPFGHSRSPNYRPNTQYQRHDRNYRRTHHEPSSSSRPRSSSRHLSPPSESYRRSVRDSQPMEIEEIGHRSIEERPSPGDDIENRRDSDGDARMSDVDPQDWEGRYVQEDEHVPSPPKDKLESDSSKSKQLPGDLTNNPWFA
ncbi:hypothetical protein GYMLUDRAFT_45855 [Collybiopsis luxurians FD-317 M1]|uniref:JmjC domain-containing protein n=1 Tax=Collybiopsis luxurians FD-317 M1 TaxID=944289 RepID=A0A0D0B365_9AGAR|nr:hypothetical protein GYMLUDRAFT_45855 [Collybiopsis luxurians FD-317 M1]